MEVEAVKEGGTDDGNDGTKRVYTSRMAREEREVPNEVPSGSL